MTARAVIIVKGDVQETGYRALVRRTARRLGLKGYVENLLDGRVRIVCEGERATVEELCKRIRIKDGLITVTSIRKRFLRPTREFEGFVVKTEDLISEIFQGNATAARYFHNLENKVDGVGDKVDGVGKKVDRVGDKVDGVGKKVDRVRDEVKGVGRKVDSVDRGVESMHKDMNKRFDRLDGSYGEFTSKMDSMDSHIREIRDDFKVLVNHVIARKDGESGG